MMDAETMLKGMREAFERSPHACRCGTKVLVANRLCGDCEEVERKHRALRDRIRAAAIPAMFAWSNFAAPELSSRVKDRTAIAKAKAAVTGRIDRVVLSGAAGIGKTTLGCAMLIELAPRLAGYFASAIDLSTARALSGLGREADVVAKALQAEVLLVDDLGLDKMSQQSAVSDVIHARHAEQRATVVTTGFDEAAIVSRYGDGIARRLYEGATLIAMRAGK
jgi:DNA replication protein DnaC